MTTTAPTRPAPRLVLAVPTARRLAAAGGAWAAGFAALHAYWASGGRFGVPAATPAIATRPLFLSYDVAASVLLAGAALIGVLLSRPTGGGRQRLLLVHLAMVGALFAFGRGGVGLLQDLVGAVGGSVGDSLGGSADGSAGGSALAVGVLCDAWFVVAGLVFWPAARRLRETARIVAASRRWG